jgi:peptidoglycan/LPS O-acetylase OafA/YrhL
MTPPSRPGASLPLVDLLKVVAAQCIVWHHFAEYGPMARALHEAAPALSWQLSWRALWAVQVFLVVGGFLAARSALPSAGAHRPLTVPDALEQAVRRWRRLLVPALAAYVLAIAAAALARALIDDPDTPAAPGPAQLLAHLFFLQDLAGLPALSSGVWYLAIDLQLQLGLLALLVLRHRLPVRQRRVATALAVLAVVAGSLLVWNRDAATDAWAIYFAGAWGLGVMAAWSTTSRSPGGAMAWRLAILLLGLVALWVEPRERVALAVIVALLLASPWQSVLQGLGRWPVLGALSRSSYALFLVHYPVALAVGAVCGSRWPGEVPVLLSGLAVAWVLSMALAEVVHRGIERRWAGAAPRAAVRGPGVPA